MHHSQTELFSEPFVEYLLKKGWTQTKSQPNIAVLRKAFGDQVEEIVLPIDRTFSDYNQRILEAVQFVAQHELRSESEIREEFISPAWDLLRIRIQGDQVGDGWISYLDKGSIEEGVRKLLLSAARSVIDPKPYFKRLYSQFAEQWMKKCRAGTAERGSYILTLQLPLNENEDLEKVPFSRKVSEYLMKSLNQLVQVAEHPSLSTETLNANLCLSLAEMKPDDHPIQFEFQMRWSPLIPVPKNIPTKVEINDRHFPSIIRIGEKLKPPAEINQDLFIGKVLTLHGTADEEGHMQGEAVLTLLVDEQQTKAKVLLGPLFYKLACDAHKENRYVRVSGILVEKPRCSDLQEISLFEIV